MKLHHRKGIDIAVARSGLTHKEFSKKLGINNQMTWWNHRHRNELKLDLALRIAELSGVTIYQLIRDMDVSNEASV